jgi:tetratricopeptide (TPR) repeat protein
MAADEGQRLRTLILRAAQALKAGRGPDAIRMQREARDLCDTMGLSRESVLMELVLGTYLVQLGQRPLAMETYQKAAARAEGGGMLKEAAQAQLALAALWLVDKRPDVASVAYGQAAELARRGDEPILAIEAYRLCGHHCADRNVKILTWRRALAVAGELDPPEAKASSAAEVARALADVLRRAGLHSQAAQMDQEGIALESGERATAAPTSDPPAARRTSGAA